MDYENIEQAIAAIKEKMASAPNEMIRRAYQDQLGKLYEAQRTQTPYDKMGGLSDDLLNFNSDFYKQYQSYLQKTMGGTGANSLLAPLMAGGVSYAGGQNLVAAKQKELAGQRQDKVNTGVQGFALQNIGMGGNLLGQQGGLGMQMNQLSEQRRQYDDQNSGWNKLFGVLGQGMGFLPGLLGGGGNVGGYYGDGNNSGR